MDDPKIVDVANSSCDLNSGTELLNTAGLHHWIIGEAILDRAILDGAILDRAAAPAV